MIRPNSYHNENLCNDKKKASQGGSRITLLRNDFFFEDFQRYAQQGFNKMNDGQKF